MPKFRSKPAEIEAVQYHPSEGWPEGLCLCGHRHALHVHTAHAGQTVDVESGDWIVREPDAVGFYPVKPAIFEKRWEPVSAPTGNVTITVNGLAHAVPAKDELTYDDLVRLSLEDPRYLYSITCKYPGNTGGRTVLRGHSLLPADGMRFAVFLTGGA